MRGEAPVIHPVALGGPECQAVLGGSIKTAAVLDWGGQKYERARPSVRKLWIGPGEQPSPRRQSLRRRHDFQRARPTRPLEATDLAVAQAVETQREDLAGDGDLGDLAAAAPGDALEVLAQRAAALAGLLGGLDQRPAQRHRALARDVPKPSAGVRAADGRRQSGPGAEVAGAREALDGADLGDDQHAQVAADAVDLAEHVDARVVLGAPVDLV